MMDKKRNHDINQSLMTVKTKEIAAKNTCTILPQGDIEHANMFDLASDRRFHR